MKPFGFKKLSIFLTVLLLITALSVTVCVAAEDSAKYKIQIESGSDVYTPESSVVYIEQGNTYTFSVPADIPTTLTDEEFGEYSVAFSNWRFSGKYEIITGSVDEEGCSFDREITLKPLSDMTAVACFFEDNMAFRLVNVDTNSDAYAPYTGQEEVSRGDTYTFAVPDKIPGFIGWEFTGDYEVVQGNVDKNGFSGDRTVILRPLSKLNAFARFEDKTEGNTQSATPDQPSDGRYIDNSKTSPKTGDTLPLWIGILIILSVSGIIAVKKIKE